MDPTESQMRSVMIKLIKLLAEESNLLMEHREELKCVARELRRLQTYCHMADAPPNMEWIRHIRHLFYSTENYIDSSLAVPAKCSGVTANLSTLMDVTEVIKSIASKVFKNYIPSHQGDRGRDLYEDVKWTGLASFDDGQMDVLIKMLVEGKDILKKRMKIVSIFGTEGLGKTTLARMVYLQLKPQFDCCAFVRMPLHHGMKEFFMEMLSQLQRTRYLTINMNERELITSIRFYLQDKRYLVVIDDLRTEEDWYEISGSFPDNDYGSRVITPTRDNHIANLCCSGCDGCIYEMQHLGDKDSKELFLNKYLATKVSCLNAHTDEILKMCGGASIASLITTKVTATKPWQDMMNKQMTSSLYSGSENILGFEDLRHILFLIYVYLPSTLKDCLLYLAVHAKNQMIHRTTMVRKWIAEGFISEYVNCSRHKLASRCFDELINRNFIQLVKYGNFIGEEVYEVNYMVLYVSRQISQQVNFITVLSDICIPEEYENSVRLSIQCSGSELSVHTEKMERYCIRSITIVGPAKFYLTNDLVYLRVLDIDGCKDLNNSAMDYICRMIMLKFLSLKHTLVSEIPPEIRLLQNLETLDVRQTQVKELPKELVQLPRLTHLYFGQISSSRGVKLPVGSDQIKSVMVLGTLDSREWSGSAMEEVSGLIELRELEVVFHDQPADKDQNNKLLSSISKCENLEYLIIYGDYNPSDVVIPVSPCFPLLERLKVAGRFVKVPQWLALLNTLKKIDIRVCKLDQDDLKILGRLPVLSTLALALISILRKKKVVITSRLHSRTCTDFPPLEETCHAGFASLEIFSFDCCVPWITFEQGAMPWLKQLHLNLYASPTGKFPSGITNLHSLEKIILWYSSGYARSDSVKNAVASVREEASSHDNLIKLSVNGENEIFQSNMLRKRFELSVNGDHEVLLSNSWADGTVTETEEASNHGNLVEPSVDVDREVLSSTRVDETISGTEIEERN